MIGFVDALFISLLNVIFSSGRYTDVSQLLAEYRKLKQKLEAAERVRSHQTKVFTYSYDQEEYRVCSLALKVPYCTTIPDL